MSLNVFGPIIPDTFDQYARVLSPLAEPVSWRDVATLAGVEFRSTTAWSDIAEQLPRPSANRLGPRGGTLGAAVSARLVDVLSTRTPLDRPCRFEVWTGYAGVSVPMQSRKTEVEPARTMYAYVAPLASATTSVERAPSDRTPVRFSPLDGQWCVSADIYSTSVIVGGDDELIGAVLRSPGIEAYPIDKSQPLTVDAL